MLTRWVLVVCTLCLLGLGSVTARVKPDVDTSLTVTNGPSAADDIDRLKSKVENRNNAAVPTTVIPQAEASSTAAATATATAETDECSVSANARCDEPDNDNGVTKVALLIPSTTRKVQYTTPDTLPIVTKLLGSFKRTYSSQYQYHLYVGYDEGDGFYDNQSNLNKLKEVIIGMGAGWNENNLHFMRLSRRPLTQIWNALFRQAYDDGCHYFFQTGDDVEFHTSHWAEAFINKLKSSPYRANFGVVGARDSGNTYPWLEEAMVARSHMDIFGYFFDPAFEDISCDVWATQTYGPENSWKLNEVVVENELRTRYKPNPGKNMVCKEVKCGRRRSCSYLRKCAAANADAFCNAANNAHIIEAFAETSARTRLRSRLARR